MLPSNGYTCNNILYNIRVTWSVLTTSCTMLWSLDHFWPPVVCITPLKKPFGLLIRLLQSQSHVTAFTHNYSLRCVTFTQLKIIHIHDHNHLFHFCTFTQFTNTTLQSLLHYSTKSLLIYSIHLHWLTSQLSVIISNYHRLYIFTLWNSRRELTPWIHFLRLLLNNWLVGLLLSNWLCHSHSRNWTKPATSFAYIAELC
jgi:hypothetical protein